MGQTVHTCPNCRYEKDIWGQTVDEGKRYGENCTYVEETSVDRGYMGPDSLQQEMLETELSHSCPVGTPHPGSCDLEEREKDRLLPMELNQSDHYRVCAGI